MMWVDFLIYAGLVALGAVGYRAVYRARHWTRCPRCIGKGYVVLENKTTVSCPTCQGTGRVPR